MKNPKGIRLYHILVSHKYEAEDLLKLLKNGKSFFELARKYSTCSSAKNDGHLGDIDFDKLDEDFKEAVELLSNGQISQIPVRTKFGYHLIMKMAAD